MNKKMTKIDELLNKSVTRKQFLATLGLAVTSILGFSTIMGILTKTEPSVGGEPGYGEQHYGH